MPIELDRDSIARQAEVAIKRHIAIWNGSNVDVTERLSTVVTEILFDACSMAAEQGPEAGIKEGLRMLKKWQD